MSTNAPSPPWDADRYRDRRPWLVARQRITRDLRRWFEDAGFSEVETPALQVSPGNETHLHAMRSDPTGPDGNAVERYLHTSPEFAMKKLLAAGERTIVNFARVYRDREHTPLHIREFTMLEWYRANAGYDVIMDDTVAVVRTAAHAAQSDRLAWRGVTADPMAQPARLSVAEAFRRHGGIDLEAAGASAERFAARAAEVGVRTAPDDDWSDIFSRVLSDKVEPHLGIGRMTLLHDYPSSEAALARRKPGSPDIAERFELYACGVELANGFAELTDTQEQRARFEAAMARKADIHGERYPIDEDFLSALAAMPEASGVALGLDRLVMLATGAPSVHHVQWMPETLDVAT